MNVEEVQAVIDSAKARGMAPLERFIRKRMPDAADEEVEEAAEVAVEIIEAVPAFMERAAAEARKRNLVMVVQPLLDQAEAYFLRPMDLIPEMTQGLAGLLDDTYLLLRILQNLERGPEPFLDWDLAFPVAFLRELMGERLGRELDALSLEAMEELSEDLSDFMAHIAREA